MRILIYGFERWITHKLLLDYQILNLTDPKKLLKLYQPGDFVLYSGWNKMDQEIISHLHVMQIPTFPNAEILLNFVNRRYATQFLDENTLFKDSYSRIYGENESIVPDFGGEKTVIKLGDSHVGKGKHLKTPGKPLLYHEPWIAEPFVKGRSIRVLILGSAYYVIEHINTSNWLKNIDPEHELIIDDYPIKIVEDALQISEKLGYYFIGIDYQLGDDGNVLPLEINVLPGCPDNEQAQAEYYSVISTAIENSK
jgi:glutathione synthase/RimK-type ligase-like ATP-grasp enzyme